MRKIILTLVFIVFSLFTSTSYAAFILNATRYVFNEGKENVAVEITNNSNEIYGGQIWVSNQNKEMVDVPFVSLPAFFKVNGKEKQIVRLIKINEQLPSNKESLFWLNVQEIPPINNNIKNAIVVAVNTQVKLIYRPKSIEKTREDAEKRIVLRKKGNSYVLENPTPYYFTVISVILNGKEIKLPQKIMDDLGVFEPYKKVILDGLNIEKIESVQISALDDYGAINIYTLEKTHELH